MKTLHYVLAVCITASAACKGGSDGAKPTRAAPSALPEVEKVALMERHYRSAIAAHDALVRGDVGAVRTDLGSLAAQPAPAGAPASWSPYDARLRAAARDAHNAKDVNEAATALANVVEACGTCHERLGAGPDYHKPPRQAGTSRVETEMLGHRWASERLWEGVTGPWDDAWQRGAAALAKANVFPPDAGESDALRAQEAALRALGEQALRSHGIHDRSVLYGRMLGTCASCHTLAGVAMPLAAASRP